MHCNKTTCWRWHKKEALIPWEQIQHWGQSKTLRFFDTYVVKVDSKGSLGQATVEAAVLLPTLMIVMAFLLQPICVAYTKMVMRSAAADTLRAIGTTSSLDDCKAYAQRRLYGVPEVSLFHVGGPDDWNIALEGGSTRKSARVQITGHVRPLPLVGVLVTALGVQDEAGVILFVESHEQTRPAWLEGSYGSWIGVWH